MHNKEKNIINPTDAASLAGSIEGNLKAGSAPVGADFKAGGTGVEHRTGSASVGADFKAGGNCNCGPLLMEGMSDIKTGKNSNPDNLQGVGTDKETGSIYSTLAGKLYLLILVGLCASVLLLLAGFGLNFFNDAGAGNLTLGSLQEHALAPADLIYLLKNNQIPAGLIISYAGLLTIILVPAAGLLYIFGYFTHRKKYNLAFTAAGVLFILVLSAVIGLLKS